MTTGAPAALTKPPGVKNTANRLARLIGCEQGVLGASTLHLFMDLFDILSQSRVVFFVDDGGYPITRWAIERAKVRGVPVKFFKHYDFGDLQRQLRQNMQNGRHPVVVCDGFCPGCGRAAPIGEYLKSIRQFGGLLILDDTQALGILGNDPDSALPYGLGGGGSLQWSGETGAGVVVVNSLAKGFGAPLAVLAGEQEFVKRFESESKTLVHCSPPSAAAINAARHALEVNEIQGDERRYRLLKLVSRLRTRLKGEGLNAGRTLFPVQGLGPIPGLDVRKVYEQLLHSNLQTVLKHAHMGKDPEIALLITIDHDPAQIDNAAAILSGTIHNVLNRKLKYQRGELCC